ncbi:hypothetical protein J3459_008343 [Metarhizium acridum]|uniref:Uncharacterized protein n=1 Tax=Metarhizium acridum (strain CQMa 102) TaxID=655827 RepID=E9E8B3_METAQ|nr:uncharacterized protein MAC_06111 [Metarhizium acridum CQMa 102]EFY87863.1 hypothetical protein MAC_06111 [Metarhizium acridum CQMa 102]KAG8423119.1 hypothetical protein J3458_000039 [Metarhizium acridum]KAG8426197.1 hypothetical protein J3459_008343 [Metarhizium acridum]
METRSSRARLRRTFRYPDDSDTPSALDEQGPPLSAPALPSAETAANAPPPSEQETLIADLAAQNHQTNTSFAAVLLALPALSTIPYMPLLFRAPPNPVIAILSLTSLLSTAYVLYKLPPPETGIAPLDAWIQGGDVPAGSETIRRLRRGAGPDKSPLEMYLPYLNCVLAGVLVVLGLVLGRGEGSFAWIGMGNLPAIVYGIVLLAKVVMGSVDPERELGGLKYGFKGA